MLRQSHWSALNIGLGGARRGAILFGLILLSWVAVFASHGGVGAQEAQGEMTSPTLSSDAVGSLTLTWATPAPAPDDYHVRWARADLEYLSDAAPDETQRGNAYPAGSASSLTLSGLTPGATYKVMIRARYADGGENNGSWSGAWTDAVSQQVSDHPPAVSEESDGQDSFDSADLRGDEQAPALDGKISPPAYEKLDYALNELLLGGTAAAAARGLLSVSRSATGERVSVIVHAEAASLQAVLKFLRKNGADVFDPFPGDNSMRADVSVSLLPSLAAHPGVIDVDAAPVLVPANAGATAHGATRWQGGGIGGRGVRIAVVDVGFRGYSSHIGSSLPRPVAVRCYHGSGTGYATTLSACEAQLNETHGTLVTEFAYDVAPEAEYILLRVHNTHQAVQALDWLVQQGVDVVTISISTREFQGPGDGTYGSYGSQTNLAAIERIQERGIIVTFAAGNNGTHGLYRSEAFRDPNGNNWLDWADGDECNRLRLAKGTPYNIALRWDDGWDGSNKDLDMYLYDGQNVVAKSEETQNGGLADHPTERFEYTPSRTANFCLSVKRSPGVSTNWYQLVVAGNGAGVGMEHTSNGYTIFSGAESVAPGALIVGAAHVNRTSSIASFSSRGPMRNGTIKPDIVGAGEGLYTTIFNSTTGGTSFSTPHVAGLAALVKQRYPWYTPAEIASWLKDMHKVGAARLPTPPGATDLLRCQARRRAVGP